MVASALAMAQIGLSREDIYQWNKDGIFHLEAKRLDESIYCFRMALSLAKSRVLHGEYTQSMNTRRSNAAKAISATSQPGVFWEAQRDDNSICMASMVRLAEDEAREILPDYLYLQPQPLFSQEPEPHIARVCVNCLFNLASAIHMKALSTGSEARSIQTERLAAVVQLYEHIYTLLLSQDIAATSANRGELHLLIAALNNLALLHNQLDRPDKAKACFETLLSSIMCIRAFGGSRFQTFDPFLLDGVFSNISKALGILTAPICAPGA
jgi:hypothetical protein